MYHYHICSYAVGDFEEDNFCNLIFIKFACMHVHTYSMGHAIFEITNRSKQIEFKVFISKILSCY